MCEGQIRDISELQVLVRLQVDKFLHNNSMVYQMSHDLEEDRIQVRTQAALHMH